jgi:nucleoside-diphosphate-sugar epimerase
MQIFIPGATGYIGSVVAEKLLAAGHRVTALARSDASAARLTAAGITPVRGDFSNPAAVGAAARAADGVINLATTYDPAVDGPAIDAILEALAGTGKPFIYTSGIWSYGSTGDTVADETTPPNPAELVRWRQAVEERVLEAAKRGVRSVVIQPAIVYGRGGGILAGFIQSAQERGAAQYVGSGQNRWPFVHVDDLADLYVLALLNAPPGTRLLAVTGKSHRVAQMAESASRGAGAGGKTAAWPLEEARQVLGAYADALVLDQQASGKRARELLGWQPRGLGVIEDLERGSYAQGGASSSE